METREIYFFRHFRDSNDLVEFCNTFVLKFVKSLSCSQKDSSSRKERTRRIWASTEVIVNEKEKKEKKNNVPV